MKMKKQKNQKNPRRRRKKCYSLILEFCMTMAENVPLKVKFSVFIHFFQTYSGAAGISSLEKITEEELSDILNDFDPIGKTSITIKKLKKSRLYFKNIFY